MGASGFSPRRVWRVAAIELAEVPRRPLYVLWTAFLAWNGFLMSRNSWLYRSVDTSVGTDVSQVNSEFQVAFVVALMGFLMLGFFVALSAGMPVIRDVQHRVGELLHSTPLRVAEYVWGRFLGALAGIFLVLALFTASVALFCHVLPDPSALDTYGPFALRAYTMPVVVFVLPAAVLMAGAAFALGAVLGRPIAVFVLPAAVMIFYSQFYWGWFPLEMSNETARILQLTDPSGFRWLKQNWLMTDRGIAFYNSQPIDYDASFLASRVAFAGLGLLLVAWSARRLERTIRGVASSARTRRRRVEEPAPKPLGATIAALGMRISAPGFLRGTRSVARFELRELLHHPGFYLFLPLVLLVTLITLGGLAQGQGGFATPPVRVSSGIAAMAAMPLVNIWTAFLVLFYGVESLRREQETRCDGIYFSTPVPTASVLLGKAAALTVLLVAMLATVFAGAGLLVRSSGMPIEWKPFFIVWGLLLLPTFALWLGVTGAVYALSRNRFVTWAVGLGSMVATAWLAIDGKITWLTDWPLATLIGWSDISVFEVGRKALVLNRVLVLLVAVLLAAVAYFAFARRDGDRLAARWPRGAEGRRRRAVFAVLALLPAVVGYTLWREVHTSFDGDAAREHWQDYWRQNLATWGHPEAALPELTHAELEIDLEPAERSFATSGYYDLVNNTGEPLPWVPVTGGLFWEDLAWTLDGQARAPEYHSGLHLFRLDEPLAPGATLRLGFAYRGVLPKGSTRSGLPVGLAEFMLPSGVVVTGRNPDFVPVVGYVADRGIDEDNRYEPRIYPRNFHEGETRGDIDRSPFTHRLVISAPSDFTVNSTGALTKREERGERTVWTWESDYPVRVFNIIAGRWEERRGEGTAVYYDRRHPMNVDTLLSALDGARRHFSQWYHPYPWKELRLSEFPAVSVYGRGNATNIFFSEGVGFLTEANPRVDLAFSVAAHEAAHSWWGHIVSHGEGPGGLVLSEGGAHFATMMLLEEMKGPLRRTSFARSIERDYGEYRQPSAERPLAETTGYTDAMIVYNKGGWAFWMLMRHMGREAFLAGVQDYFRTFHMNRDHPVIQDFVAVLRPYAADPEAYDRFVEQWFFGLEIGEYRIARAEKRALSEACAECAFEVEVELRNAGSGEMPVEVAAVRGRRFERDGTESADYRDCRGELVLGAGESGTVELSCTFEPERVVVDPDVHVLQLQRQAATVRLR